MIRIITLIGVLLAPAVASAGPLLSGGMSIAPRGGIIGASAWRLGFPMSDRATLLASATYGSFNIEGTGAWVLRPGVGARVDFSDRGEGEVTGFFTGMTQTVVGGVNDDGNSDGESARPTIGLQGGLGLDAGITEHASFSAEVGLDTVMSGSRSGDWLTDATYVSAYVGGYLNFWL